MNLPRSASFSPQEHQSGQGRPCGLKPALRTGSSAMGRSKRNKTLPRIGRTLDAGYDQPMGTLFFPGPPRATRPVRVRGTAFLLALLAMVFGPRARPDTALVFNEVMYHPATQEPALEWVEFYNQMAVDLDVSRWRVTGDLEFTFPEGTRAPGQGYLVLALDPAALQTATGLNAVLGPYTKRLSNGGGTLELRNPDGRPMDRLQFEVGGDWPVTPDGAGVSLAKRDRDTGSARPDRWAASEQPGGTPGRENFPLPGEPPLLVSFNELSGSTNPGFWVELINDDTQATTLAGWVVRWDGATNVDYVIPAGVELAAGDRLVLDEASLGFHPSPGDRLFLFTPNRARVADGVLCEARPSARSPEGAGPWRHPAEPTPHAPNRVVLHEEIVINEIMYHAALLSATNGLPSPPSDEQWLELYNRGSNTVDLAGWELDGGVRYQFAPGQQLAPGAYLVVARDAASLRQRYPTATIVGDFTGRLSRRGESIRLRDTAGNLADTVRYFDGGHWPDYADGGGSSLELRDPFADNANAAAWAASDESAASAWQTIRYRMVAGYPSGSQPTQWRDFILGLLDTGECLVDDLEVTEVTGGAPTPLVGNGDFENGLTGWRLLGTHRHSRVIVDPENAANHVLHVVATGPQEHMHNHLETTLLNGRSVVDGREYEVAFRARWLAGNNRLNTRLYFNRVARTTALPMPSRSGTPGARNSRFTPNLGPTFSGFAHTPVVPAPGMPVTVSVAAQDPHGIATATLWWSANGGAWTSASMAPSSEGQYTASIPGFPTGTLVQFYVQAADALGAEGTYPPAGRDSGALYVVKDNQFEARRGHNLRLLLTPTNRDLLHAFTNVMSNDELPGTVIVDERRAYYDIGLRLKGSQRGRYSDTRVSFHVRFQPDDLFRDVHPVMLIDRSGAGDSTGNKQLEILIKHLLTRVGGIAGPPADLCKVIAPRTTHSSSAILAPRLEDEFLDTAFAEGGDGTVFELELIYYPTTANSAGYKNPQPDNVLGVDLQDLGTDPELYRYNFLIKNHRDADDYRAFMRFARTLSLSGTPLEEQSRAVMDLSSWMRAWALVTLCGVGDSYTFGNDHNLMMYLRPEDGRMVPFPVDMDFSFVRSPNDGLVGDRNLSRVINLPANLRLFYAHVLDLIAAGYNPTYMQPWVTHYNRFVPEQSYTSITDYIRRRGEYAVEAINSAGGSAPFTLAGPSQITAAANLVTLSGTAPVTLQTLEVNGVAWPLTWTSLNQWTLRLPVSNPTNVLELAGFDLHGNPLPNATASVTVRFTGPAVEPEDQIVFSEIMYHPAAPNASYVELFNRSPDTAFDLSGWRVDGLGLTFPPGTALAAGHYLLLAGDRAGFMDAYPPSTPTPWAVFPGKLRNGGETLTLLRPGADPDTEIVVTQARYASSAPWPTAANGAGPSLQLVDPAQDSRRVANWAAADVTGPAEPRWVQVVAQGTASSSSLYVYLESAGDLYLDDLRMVPGSVPDVGPNSIQNGDFESPLSGPWVVSPNHAGSALSTTIKRSGSASLHLVASSGGTTRASSIYQELSPALVSGQPYTLSFWYRQSTNGGPLTLRLSGRGLTVTVDPAPMVSGPYTPGAPNSVARSLAPFPPLWLNEVQPMNSSGPTDNHGEREPWIELFNAGPAATSLDGLFLASDFTAPDAWAFPSGLSLAPGQCLLVWADGEPAESDGTSFHTSFRLGGPAGTVVLSRHGNQGAEVLDYLDYADLAADDAYGSLPDGDPYRRGVLPVATPGATNSATAPAPVLFVNEWMAANTAASGIADPADNRFQDWFELFNPGERRVSLQDWYLSDVTTNQFKFRIPAGYVVPPRGHLLVWADEETSQNQPDRPDLHVNFRLSQDGEAIVLTRPDGTVADLVVFGAQTENVSQGRSPDGGAAIQFFAAPSPRAANGPATPVLPPVLSNLRITTEGTLELTVETVVGRTYQLQYSAELGGAGWTPVGEPKVASATTLVFFDSIGTDVSRFYRVAGR